MGCPSLDCSVFDDYALRDLDGVLVCERRVHLFSGERCVALGVCRAVATLDVCGDVRTLESARTASACETLAGCEGTTGPTPAVAPVGTACGDEGRCNAAGACDETIVQTCPEFAEAVLCGAGVHDNGDQHCELVGDAACSEVCTRYGRACLAAWAPDPEDPCVAGERIGCLDARPATRCRCTRGVR
jgi:hypothetical protein